MPYRRLPNTDSARIRAMKAALEKGKNIHPFELAYSQALYVKLKAFYPLFETAVKEQRIAMQVQATNNKQFLKLVKKAQMYISHFIQVLNLAILRDELPEKIRPLYGLKLKNKKVPSLASEEEIIAVGKKIIEGEEIRTRQGGTPLLNPKIAMVKLHFERFLDAYHHQKILKENSARAHDKVAKLRIESDKLILKIWNEVEEHFSKFEAQTKRNYCQKYGIVYVYRKNELAKAKNVLQMSA
ncbi:MAG: hypothetical protein L3J74_08610 [Bacteroidales bacterium]|nr:hypothetical protein [Bacteroidales bacterium]